MDLDQAVNCAACGYDLTGVGWEGRCPECGGGYDKSRERGVVRGGQGPLGGAGLTPSQRGERLVVLVKLGAYGAIGGICLLWGGIASLSSSTPARPLALGLLGAGVFGFAVYATWFLDKRGDS